MRLLLVFPYTTQRHAVRWYPAEPLSLLCLATYVRDAMPDAKVRILDCLHGGPPECDRTEGGWRCGMADAVIEAVVAEYAPDVIGVTNSYTMGTRDVLALLPLLRRAAPHAFIALGGAHATVDDGRMAALPDVDAVVRGEGERTLAEILGRLEAGRGLEGVQGVTYRRCGCVVRNEDRPLIEDVDALPIPDRALIPYREYLAHSGAHYSHPKQTPVGTVFSARGCPFRCVFCSTARVWRNVWRGRSAARMFEEVAYLRDVYGVREIAFQDDQFLGRVGRVREFCRLVIESGLGLTFLTPPGLSPALLDAETLGLMREAGWYRVCLSIDAGSPASVRYSRKPVKLAKVRGIVRAANRLGLWTYGTFVLGYPFEGPADVWRTVRYAYGLRLDAVIFYLVQPHLGSPLHDRMLAEGRLGEGRAETQHLPDEAQAGTDRLSARALERARWLAQRVYPFMHALRLLNPFYLLGEFLPKVLGGRAGYARKVALVWMDLAGLSRVARALKRRAA